MRTIALALTLAGCGAIIPDGRGPVDCTADERSSVVVTLITESGERLTEGEVTFQPAGADVQACESWGDGTFVCGWEVAGPITIFADAWGWGPAEVQVDVQADECHVQTETIELTLPYINCPDELLYAVMVSTVDSAGRPVSDARVEAMPLGENWTFPERCEPWGDNLFACGPSWTGEVEIWAMSRGVGSFYEVVDVPFDECGPITVDLTATLSR